MYQGRLNGIVEVKCPYFISEFTMSITCEGMTDDARSNMTRFEDQDAKDSHMKKHCMHYPNGCRIAAALDEKYK